MWVAPMYPHMDVSDHACPHRFTLHAVWRVFVHGFQCCTVCLLKNCSISPRLPNASSVPLVVAHNDVLCALPCRRSSFFRDDILVYNAFACLVLVPLALKHSSPLLGFFAATALFGALGFAVVPMCE